MMEVITIVSLIPAVFGIVSSSIAVINGLKNRRKNKQFTQVEQENDLKDYMVDECSRVEAFSSFLKGSMNKEQLSTWKKNEVLKNVGLYASANGYSWYNKGVWEINLDNYITKANEVAGKSTKTKATPVAG